MSIVLVGKMQFVKQLHTVQSVVALMDGLEILIPSVSNVII